MHCDYIIQEGVIKLDTALRIYQVYARLLKYKRDRILQQMRPAKTCSQTIGPQ